MSRWIFCLLVSFLFWTPGELACATDRLEHEGASVLSFEVNYVYRSAGVGELKGINNGDVLRSGDHYKIVFTPDKDCFVYVFQIDSSKQVFQLFPMQGFRGVRINNFNPVKQGKTYILPSADKAFVLDQKTGAERIYFIASTERDTKLESLYGELKEAIKRNDSNQSKQTRSKLNKYFRRRGIKVVPSEKQMEIPWRETGDVFSVISQKIETLGSDSIHVLEFVHQ